MTTPPPSSKTAQVQDQVNDVVNIMQENVQRVMQRGENLETLQDRTENLQSASSQFQRQSKSVRRQMFWKDTKTRIMLGAVVVLILVVIPVGIWWGTSSGGNKGGDKGQTPNPKITSTSASEPAKTGL
ncbi:hypothetical protein HDV05_001175 [Chytridiales sp. JEL 0842]|nr:hypothetical protein HDV05_001175 [Chytridiales sp. JEL 0842]